MDFVIFILAVSGIFGLRALSKRRTTPAGESLPCPNLPCGNRLPRRGMWSHAKGEWAVEECPVCGASIQYRSGIDKSAALSLNDCYIRVVPTGEAVKP